MTTDGTGTILVDTNVLVYAYDPRDRPKQERAEIVLERLGGHGGALTVQVLGEFFWTMTRKLRPPLATLEATRSVARYIASWHVYPLTTAVVAEAVRGADRLQLPYWDALIWATAKLNQVPLVLSEDFNNGAVLEGVQFLNPFAQTFDLALLQPGP